MGDSRSDPRQGESPAFRASRISATASAAIPSPRPEKSQSLVGRRLDAHALWPPTPTLRPSRSAHLATLGARILGRSATTVTSRLHDSPAVSARANAATSTQQVEAVRAGVASGRPAGSAGQCRRARPRRAERPSARGSITSASEWPSRPNLRGELDPAEHQRADRRRSDERHSPSQPASAYPSARPELADARSPGPGPGLPGVVILRFSYEPGNTATGMTARSKQLGVVGHVGIAVGAVRVDQAVVVERSGEFAPPRDEPARRTLDELAEPRPSLIVSLTGTAATAPPTSRATRRSRARAGPRSGRAGAIVDRHPGRRRRLR